MPELTKNSYTGVPNLSPRFFLLTVIVSFSGFILKKRQAGRTTVWTVLIFYLDSNSQKWTKTALFKRSAIILKKRLPAD